MLQNSSCSREILQACISNEPQAIFCLNMLLLFCILAARGLQYYSDVPPIVHHRQQFCWCAVWTLINKLTHDCQQCFLVLHEKLDCATCAGIVVESLQYKLVVLLQQSQHTNRKETSLPVHVVFTSTHLISTTYLLFKSYKYYFFLPLTLQWQALKHCKIESSCCGITKICPHIFQFQKQAGLV